MTDIEQNDDERMLTDEELDEQLTFELQEIITEEVTKKPSLFARLKSYVATKTGKTPSQKTQKEPPTVATDKTKTDKDKEVDRKKVGAMLKGLESHLSGLDEQNRILLYHIATMRENNEALLMQLSNLKKNNEMLQQQYKETKRKNKFQVTLNIIYTIIGLAFIIYRFVVMVVGG